MRSVGNASRSAPGKKVVETEIIARSLSSGGVPWSDVWYEEVEALRSHNKGSRTGGVGIWAADTDLDRGGRTVLDVRLSAEGAKSWASPSETNCKIESHSFASILESISRCTVAEEWRRKAVRGMGREGVREGA